MNLEKIYSLLEENKILFSSTVVTIEKEINEYLSAWWHELSDMYILIHGPFTNDKWQDLDYIIFDKQSKIIISDFYKIQKILFKHEINIKRPITYNHIPLNKRNFFNIPVKYKFNLNKNNLKKYKI